MRTDILADVKASMGPCLFRHGNLHFKHRYMPVKLASMGPCLFRHGNALFLTVFVDVFSLLQWGRAFSGTEI